MESLRWSRILAVVAFVLLLAEGFGQAFMYAWSGEAFRSLQVQVWSPYGLVRNNPRLTSPEFKHTAQFLRSTRTFDEHKPPRTLRVLLLGASVLYGAVTPTKNTRDDEARTRNDETIDAYLEEMLRADPALAGVNVEVINAAVSFNRYVESATAYMDEYVFWQPDVVVVCGSYNNIGEDPDAGVYDARKGRLMGRHPWQIQFDREVNDLTFAGFVGRGVRTLNDSSAAAALLVKGLDKGIDTAFRAVGRVGDTLFPPAPTPVKPVASPEEIGRLADAMLGYVNAMIALAHHHGQEIAFYWEYLHGDIQDFAAEGGDPRTRYSGLAMQKAGDDVIERRRYAHYYYLDRLRSVLTEAGAPFVDPFAEFVASKERIFVDYLHYTPAGNRLAAQVIHDRLRPIFKARAERLRAEPPAPTESP